MTQTYKMTDPFNGMEVTIERKLTDRLRGKYGIGPIMKNGEPEFGYRITETTPIGHEAADEIERLQKLLKDNNIEY